MLKKTQLRSEIQQKRVENKKLSNELINEEMYIKKLREDTKRLNKLLSDDMVKMYS